MYECMYCTCVGLVHLNVYEELASIIVQVLKAGSCTFCVGSIVWVVDYFSVICFLIFLHIMTSVLCMC